MKLLVHLTGACAIAVLLTNCGSSGTGAQVPGTGPFDSRGNYVEAWADNPAKWRKPGGSTPSTSASDAVPEIAKNEQPPMNSVPLAANTSSATTSKPVPIIKVDTLTPVAAKPRPKPSASSEVVSKPKSKPKVVSKPKVKPKPAPKRYVVKAGDSLSAIASRNGTSVSALQRANGVKGTLIRPGQSLVIPK